MKHIKILPLVQLACLSPITISLVSCSKTVDWKQDALDEFLGSESKNIAGIVSVPRPGYYHDKIIPYLTDRITSISKLNKKDVYVDNAGNIMFDIPASKGCEGKDMVIIQGHSDMIVAGLSEAEAKTTPIEAVVDGDTIHSKNNSTSLGADNGIGLSMALAMLKNRNSFKHGPLRFIFTADEDVGMVGANKMKSSWLMKDGQTIKWLINIDAENEYAITRSCNGNIRLKMWQEFQPCSPSERLDHTYEIKIDNLLGGHSGIDIIKKRANAERLVYNFLSEVTGFGGYEVQIVQHNHSHIVDGRDVDVDYSMNQIISNCTLVINTNATDDKLEEISSEVREEWKELYPYENWDRDVFEIIEDKTGFYKDYPFIDQYVSERIIELIGQVNDRPEAKELTHLYYGPFIFLDETTPDASANIGPVNIKYDEKTKLIHAEVGTSCRSSVLQEKQKHSITWFDKQYKRIVQSFKLQYDNPAIYYPWPKDENNHLVQLLSEGYKQQGIEPVIEDVIAGIEPAIWYYKSGHLTTCACLGAHVDGAHSVNEVLHIETIEPAIKNVIYALEELAK